MKEVAFLESMRFGGGGSQPEPPTRVSDNLRSEDTVEILIGLGEGPWAGLKDHSLKNLFIADTPLEAADGTVNFPDAEVILHKGTADPDPIVLFMGGTASPTTVGVNLSSGEGVTRTTTSGDFDAIDVRLRIDSLFRTTEEGAYLNEQLLYRIEVKLTSEPDSAFEALPSNAGWAEVVPYDGEYNSAELGSGWSDLETRAEYLVETHGLTQEEAYAEVIRQFQTSASGYVDPESDYAGYTKTLRVTGATQSPVVKEIRIPVERTLTDTYDIRVTKLSPETTNTSTREITWDIYETVSLETKAYPNTAMLQILLKSSDQLSSIPPIYGIYDTLEMKVPTIFDPVTHSYDYSNGPWDGSFKLASTDDLAWNIYNLIHNDTHGIASYYQINFSKYEAEAASLWWNACDELTGEYVGVPRPNGNGTRPRITYNGAVDSPRNSMELLNFMAGSGNAVFYEDAAGVFKLRVEKDEQASHIFTQEDILGDISYSYTDTSSRYNDITVVYKNAQLPRYQEDRRRVFDQDDINLNGSKPFNFIAVGCTDTDEAIARAQHKLITSLTEKETIVFTTTRKGMYVEPHDLIMIADPDMATGESNRCISLSADRKSLVPHTPFVPQGIAGDYKVSLQTAEGMFESTVAAFDAETNTITLAEAVPDEVEKLFSFALNSTELGELKTYRVVSILPSPEDYNQITLTAIEVNLAKYNEVDNFDGSQFDVAAEVEALPENISELSVITSERDTVDGKVNDIELVWEGPSNDTAGGTYVVHMAYEGGSRKEVQRSSNLGFTMLDVAAGRYVFTVAPLLLNGFASNATRSVAINVADPVYSLPAVDVVTIQNQKTGSTDYIGQNVNIEWAVDTSEQWKGWATNMAHPDFARYEIDVVDTLTGSIVHTYIVTDWEKKSYEIPYSDFNFFGLSNIRDFAVVVTISNEDGIEGGGFSRAVTKPVALAPTPITFVHPNEGSPRGRMMFSEPTDPDYQGVKVWVSTSVNAHLDPLNNIWDGKGTPVLEFVDGVNHISYQMKDVFGTTGQTVFTTTYTADVADVLEQIDFVNEDIEELETAAQTAASDILGLIDTYGSTASAAQSAQDAADALGITQSALGTAIAARDDALGHANSANTSASDAAASETASGNSAAAASTSESAAGTSATAAATDAAAARTNRLSAQTASGNASASASDAATSATNASEHESASATNASNAANSEAAAGGSAIAASDSASLATTRASEAGTSASAADSSRVAAEAAATNSGTSASSSASSASAASASETASGQNANSASTSANQAATQAGNAQTFANQAATSATTASGSASTATTQAGIAVSASNAASLTATLTRPSTFEEGAKHFTQATTGTSVANFPDADLNGLITSGSGSDGPFLRNVSTTQQPILRQKQLIPYVVGDTYRTTALIRRISGFGGQVYLRGRVLSGDYTTTYSVHQSLVSSNPATTLEMVTFEFMATQEKYNEGVRLITAEIVLNDSASHTLAVYSLDIQNISSEAAAGDFASEAQTYSNSAALAATSATGSASTATTQAGLAVSAATNAATQASAAATSASDASSSATAAGQSSTSATTSANSAATAAGAASVSATSSATSASNASNAATAAQNILEVVARAQAASYSNNPSFLDWNDANPFPTGFRSWGTGATSSRETGLTKFGNGVRQVVTANSTAGIETRAGTAFNGGYGIDGDNRFSRRFVLSAWVYLVSGNFEGVGLYLNTRDSSFVTVTTATYSFHTEEPAPATGKWYRFEKYFDSEVDTENTVSEILLYARANWASFAGGQPSKEIIWGAVDYRPATSAEIEVGSALNISGTVTTMSSVLAELQGRVSAHWQQETSVAGFTGTFISARTTSAAGVVSSEVSFGAREIGLYNNVNGAWLQAMRVVGGDVRLSGNLEAGAGIFLGTGAGRWPVSLQDKEYNEADGSSINFGQDLGDYDVAFTTIGLDNLLVGESYRLRAINKTGTGFTPELKITTVGAASSVTQATNATSPVGPSQMVAKAEPLNAYNDVYLFHASGSVDILAYEEVLGGGGIGGAGTGVILYLGVVQFETWFHNGSIWVQGPDVDVDYTQLGVTPTHTTGTQSFTFSDKSFPLTYTGTIRQHASLGCFGCSASGGGALTNLNKVVYIKQAQSGTRTATPSGQTGQIIVKPRNLQVT